MKDKITALGIVDPNPTELTECSLTISGFEWQTLDGDKIAFEMVELYDRQSKFALIGKVLSDLEKYGSSVVYVGTREKCEKWSEIFLKIGLMTEIFTF